MMTEHSHAQCYRVGDLVDREIDGVWFEGIVTDCVDSALFTCYSVQYEDDGKVEHYIDEGDLRPRAARIIRPSEDAATNKCNVFNIDNIRNFRMSYSADDLVISHRPYLHTPKTTSRRRWSIDFSHTHPPRPSTLPHTPQQSLQQKRFLNESPDLFLPLAARCANPSCRKMTLFRCHRCGSSFSCSAACQKQVWTAGHREECVATLFVPLFAPSPRVPPTLPVTLQNDWLVEDASSAPEISSAMGATDELDEICTGIEAADFFDFSARELYSSPDPVAPSSVAVTPSSSPTLEFPTSPGTAELHSPEPGGDSEAEFDRKVTQLSEAFCMPYDEVGRVLRFYGHNEDAAVECLVMGGRKSEEEVLAEVSRIERIRAIKTKRQLETTESDGGEFAHLNMRQLREKCREVGLDCTGKKSLLRSRLEFYSSPGAVKPSPGYSDAMVGIDEKEDSGGEVQMKSAGTVPAMRMCEDWSHLYSQINEKTNFEDDVDEEDTSDMPPLIDSRLHRPNATAPSQTTSMGSVQDGHCDIDDERFKCMWDSKPPINFYESQEKSFEFDTTPLSPSPPLCQEPDSSGFKALTYFLLNPECTGRDGPVATHVDPETGCMCAILFEGPAFLGKRLAKVTVSCVLKPRAAAPDAGCLSVDEVRVRMEPRDEVEALYVGVDKEDSTGVSTDNEEMERERYLDRLLVVEGSLPGLLVMLSLPSHSHQLPQEKPPHAHELNLSLIEAIDVLLLYSRREKGQAQVFHDSFSTREWLDTCFWHVAEALAHSEECSRKRSTSTGREGTVACGGSVKAAGAVNEAVLDPRALGVMLAQGMLMHMKTGLLNPFSSISDSSFDVTHACRGTDHNKCPEDRRGGEYLKYVLLGYQVQYSLPGQGGGAACARIQSDCFERVTVRKVESGLGDGGTGCKEEELARELMDILMVDRNTALSALSATNGDLNQAMEWLLSKLDFA